MRHIKIYEDYSDEEIKDLIGDLKSVGQVPFKPQIGRDYGWTSSLLSADPSSSGVSNVYFSLETVDYMEKKGMIDTNLTLESKRRLYLKPDKEWSSSYGSYGPGNYRMDHSLILLNFADGKALYGLVGTSGDYGFGISLVKGVGKKARLHCQNQFLDKFKKFIDKKGYL